MGAVCCCLHEDREDYVNPNSSIYRHCVCLRCFLQNFLHVGTASLTSTSSLDDSLPDMYRSPPRPLPYDADPRYIRLQRDGLVSRREKGSGHSHEETEPLRRSDFDADSELSTAGDKWNESTCEEGPKEYNSKSSLKLSTAKMVTGYAHMYSSSEDEDVCPTCLEEYTSENPKIITKCTHHFHLGCIYEWMERSESCPVCGKVMLGRYLDSSTDAGDLPFPKVFGTTTIDPSFSRTCSIHNSSHLNCIGKIKIHLYFSFLPIQGYKWILMAFFATPGLKAKDRNLRIPRQLPPELFGCPGGGNSRWLDIACGREHTAAVASDGSLFTWGANEFGQLGDGTENGRKHPKKVKQLQTEFVISVSCGAHCTAAIAEPRENDGTISTRRLWVWGQNQGSNCPRLYWGAFTPNTIIRQVSCGAVHVVALSDDGLLQAWGYNEYGQLGRGTTCEGLQGARVISAYAKFLDEAPELVKITQVSCGEYHTAAISEKGEVYTWGLGSMGQLGHCSLQFGDKELVPRRVVALDGIAIKDIACGGVHTCAVTMKGALYAWGGGQAGQLDGRIHGWGYNSYGQAANEKSTYAWYPSPVDWCVGEVRKLAAGGGHSAVLTDACSLKELCEFRLADSVTLSNASEIEDVASRTGSDALARLCERLREHLLDDGDCQYEDDEFGNGRN
ncbi:hypothetical protein F0562_004307 [Nyssa sinensis]|uniref:RING-type domain-containing protein n=1 Tax=Nyssa sinensis TaxID=561372 RepID=A0A5J5BY60_9ASTE|nr:hypothetical protein F0562_004307 [Nyssa sinensis]